MSMMTCVSARYLGSPLIDVEKKSLWRKVVVVLRGVKSAVCWALPGLVDTLTSKETSDRGIPASVVVAWAYRVTLPASSLTSTSVCSQPIVIGT